MEMIVNSVLFRSIRSFDLFVILFRFLNFDYVRVLFRMILDPIQFRNFKLIIRPCFDSKVCMDFLFLCILLHLIIYLYSYMRIGGRGGDLPPP